MSMMIIIFRVVRAVFFWHTINFLRRKKKVGVLRLRLMTCQLIGESQKRYTRIFCTEASGRRRCWFNESRFYCTIEKLSIGTNWIILVDEVSMTWVHCSSSPFVSHLWASHRTAFDHATSQDIRSSRFSRRSNDVSPQRSRCTTLTRKTKANFRSGSGSMISAVAGWRFSFPKQQECRSLCSRWDGSHLVWWGLSRPGRQFCRSSPDTVWHRSSSF